MSTSPLELEIRALLDAGDHRRAGEVVIQRLGPSIKGVLCSLHGEDDGGDVFSTWAEDVWRGLPGFRWECSLRAWAFRIAHHASHRLWRDPWRARRNRLATSAASRLAASIPSIRLEGGLDDRLELLRSDLTRDEHELIALRVSRQLSWDEVALVLSSEGETPTPQTLRKRYERLKGRMQRLAKEKGLL